MWQNYIPEEKKNFFIYIGVGLVLMTILVRLPGWFWLIAVFVAGESCCLTPITTLS